ncbi:MAG: Indigoidine synthase A family protein [Halanaerobium sp. 4-GBenrich]|jgi:pseudouridine-5'-phosphate glycosidase|uniref:Pseudouridine-5'-phosphate glycosidase n=1 Tax=Halanaerobium congolense TaxID=54121 RepID=A0A1G6JIR5_9FIRM|nr:pseudouridine-5'-phosphate glycosidase [Halanaerobium congolense]KXS48318.1 MAG: Indigoidine synthase A family protein [Halanaerobium sp. T82-1]ODS50531.1 MAG: Indigoidine synthase A family protein [Halanaerobium sp. 4-GBenrich]OEG63410.1 MAG: pseudouridine-5-phosphate glycosidase [Halanaerobium sp. MDAL1]PUU92812.1 MAG: Indigoidine synthase A family protein [Halanaerobium sp.]PXV65587.1 pseudouridine-5'-phosphate glycosidase [Halanaerobium congolense]
MKYLEKYLEIKAEVKEALESGKPVVALESTIIAHGMPYPQNIETALEIEDIIRANGAVPATIGIIDGKIKVGLTKEEVEFLGESDEIVKVSRRDLPVVLAEKKHGATTVAGTMIAADLAGIKIFVTGGVGGVHRGAETSFDVSADLEELKKTSVAVIAAGAKSILDLGLTLEKLESFGVPVLGYQTEELPAFYSRHSGFNVDYKLENPEHTADILQAKWELGLEGGVLIANPVPEADEIEYSVINEKIEQALTEAESQGISGKELTPFLLDRIKEITAGKSLETNIALVRNNAVVGAKIAKAFAAKN